MSRTARLFELLITLGSRPQFTVAELAERFDVSRRTMLRDLHVLSQMGVPLAATPGPGGGYSLIHRERLLTLSLSPEEAIGMVLSYEAFLQYAQSPFAPQSLSAVTKLRNALPPHVVAELDRVRRHVVVLEAVRRADTPLLPRLLAASLDRVHLDIRYDSVSGESKRRIYPYGLFASHGLWYCVCHDSRRDAILALRADRVREAKEVPGEEPPPPVDLREWLKTYRSGAADMLELRAAVTRRGARNLEFETLFGEIALDEGDRGALRSQIPAAEIDFYAARLLTLGDDITVEEPSALVRAIRDKARSVAALYE